VSPDGRTLVYVGTENLDGDEWGHRARWLLDLDSGEERLLGDGYSPADGPDLSPDGAQRAIDVGVLDLYRRAPGGLSATQRRDALSAADAATLILWGLRSDPGDPRS
jgi:hypothetical protein